MAHVEYKKFNPYWKIIFEWLIELLSLLLTYVRVYTRQTSQHALQCTT